MFNPENSESTPRDLLSLKFISAGKSPLCNLISNLVTNRNIKLDDIILLEADPSHNSKLIKMYESMSFKNKGYAILIRDEYETEIEYDKAMRERGALMTTTIAKLLQWYKSN